MTSERVLAEVVLAWATEELSGDATRADRAAAVAVDAYVKGASVAEACGAAPTFLGSWVRHPANEKVGRDALARLAC